MNPNFLTGFANSLSQGLEDRQKTKLALMMQSSQIEQQLMAKALEKQIEDRMGIGNVSPEQAGGLLGMAGGPKDAGQQLSSLFGAGKTVPEKLISPIAGAIGASQRIPALANVPAGVDPNTGQPLYSMFNRKTGERSPAAPIAGDGVTQASAKDLVAAKKSGNEMRGIISLVDSNIKGLITAAGASGLPEQAMRNKVNQYLQKDAGAMKAYQDTIASHNARFELALSHNPRLASQIQQQAGAQWGDPLADIGPTWEKKKQNLLNLVNNSEQATFNAYGRSSHKPNADQQATPKPATSPKDMRKALGLD